MTTSTNGFHLPAEKILGRRKVVRRVPHHETASLELMAQP
jgi:hypothetical protein